MSNETLHKQTNTWDFARWAVQPKPTYWHCNRKIRLQFQHSLWLWSHFLSLVSWPLLPLIVAQHSSLQPCLLALSNKNMRLVNSFYILVCGSNHVLLSLIGLVVLVVCIFVNGRDTVLCPAVCWSIFLQKNACKFHNVFEKSTVTAFRYVCVACRATFRRRSSFSAYSRRSERPSTIDARHEEFLHQLSMLECLFFIACCAYQSICGAGNRGKGGQKRCAWYRQEEVSGPVWHHCRQICLWNSQTHEIEPWESYFSFRWQWRAATNRYVSQIGTLSCQRRRCIVWCFLSLWFVTSFVAALMSQIYDRFKDEDGFLYVTYSGENTFVRNTSFHSQYWLTSFICNFRAIKHKHFCTNQINSNLFHLKISTTAPSMVCHAHKWMVCWFCSAHVSKHDIRLLSNDRQTWLPIDTPRRTTHNYKGEIINEIRCLPLHSKCWFFEM